MPELRDGYIHPNGRPGWRIGFDEALAARHPCRDDDPLEWVARLPDGATARP